MPKNEAKYISLSNAAKIYGCTQKHLNFMVRQKRLRAVKISRNWVTTQEWLDEFAKSVQSEKNPQMRIEFK